MAFGNEQAKQAQSLTSCREQSVSSELSSIATMRDKAGSFTFDVEAKTEAICMAFVYNLYGTNKEMFDIVAMCRPK